MSKTIRPKLTLVQRKFLERLSQSADLIGVVYDHMSVVKQLQAAGYQDNQHTGVGHPPEWFCTRRRVGEYLVGQAINCLLRGMGPHPSLTPRFVAQYESLPYEQPGSSFDPNTTETPREKRYRNCLEDIQRMTETRICDLEDIGCVDTFEFDTLCSLRRRINRTLRVRKITSKQIANKLRDYEPGN